MNNKPKRKSKFVWYPGDIEIVQPDSNSHALKLERQ